MLVQRGPTNQPDCGDNFGSEFLPTYISNQKPENGNYFATSIGLGLVLDRSVPSWTAECLG